MFNCVIRGVFFNRFCTTGGHSDTIFALASGHTRSPISIIRVGGRDSYKTISLLLKDSKHQHESKKELLGRAMIKERFAHYKSIYTCSKEPIDKSIVIYYPAQSSYNGEDIFELQIHGSKAVIKAIFLELRRLNFRMAEKGQFTKRAILNNKMDYLQAEGIHELIMSESEFSRKVALGHLLGDTSKHLQQIKTELVSCLAASEAFIDFPGEEEDIREDLLDKTKLRVMKVINQLERCMQNRRQVELLTEGVYVTIVGRPNVGKSTIINKMVKKEVAIVSDIPGTTRDLINASIEHQGVVIHLTDTAGLRETNEAIQKQGIKRAVAKTKESHINVYVVDPTMQQVRGHEIYLHETNLIDEQLLSNENTLVVVNKSDISEGLSLPITVHTKKGIIKQCSLLISALQEDHIDRILSGIVQQANNHYKFEEFQTQMMLTKERHYTALQDTLQHLKGYIHPTLPVDACCEQLREAIVELGRITGRVDTEQVLDVLFRDFCIGK